MLFSFEVILQCLHQLTHCEILFVIHIVFDCGQRVGDCSDTYSLQIVRIVARTSGIVVLAVGDAVVGDDGKERCRHVFRIDTGNHIASLNLDIRKMLNLLFVSIKQLVIALKVFRFSQL